MTKITIWYYDMMQYIYVHPKADVLPFSLLICQYQCSWLSWKTSNHLLCDMKSCLLSFESHVDSVMTVEKYFVILMQSVLPADALVFMFYCLVFFSLLLSYM